MVTDPSTGVFHFTTTVSLTFCLCHSKWQSSFCRENLWIPVIFFKKWL